MTMTSPVHGGHDLAQRMEGVNFGTLSDPQPADTKTWVERAPHTELTELQRQWREDGVVILRNFIPADLRQAYCEERERMLPRDRSQRDNFWGGWHHPYPYMDSGTLKQLALYRPLTEALREVIGDELGLHLALTGWVSTERNFHQDTYLNPPDLWSHYVAAWIALDDVHADAGPFQFVRGSHTWNVLRRDKLMAYLTPEEREMSNWPSFTQEWVSQACEAEIARRGASVEEFIPKGGDLLIWHSNLIHRGSQPRNPELLRKSLICHYSSVKRRTDFGSSVVDPNGSHYYAFPPVDQKSPLSIETPAATTKPIPARVRELVSRLLGR
ncbi:MAG: phytanoyl-CoA dioxygenase family protein [Pseudomonadota bacterium]